MKFLIFCFFFVSGFCSLLYQTIWLRLAFAHFGVITPVVSVVISVFMLGLALGSWLGGKYIGSLVKSSGQSAMFFYGIAELVTAAGGFLVPHIFQLGEKLLLSTGNFDSLAYLGLSALTIALSILPWSIAMGATYPFALAFLKSIFPKTSNNAFGFLYVANVAGATIGVLITAGILIETLGFAHCLMLASLLNLAIAASAIALSKVGQRQALSDSDTISGATDQADSGLRNNNFFGLTGWILFLTGFISLAMEVAWTRLLTPVLGTVVYSFALILTVYLASTFIGSFLYRAGAKLRIVMATDYALSLTAIFSFLPVVINDPRLTIPNSAAACLFSIAPFSMALGYLTPSLIDKACHGDPKSTGTAYSINIVGGIFGPLLAAYCLLPTFGLKFSLVYLGLPLVFLAAASIIATKVARPFSGILTACALVAFIYSSCCWSWEENFPSKDSNVHRDYAATTVSTHSGNGQKQLYVNGVNMTSLCLATKFMAHTPLLFCPQPKNALAIGFGEGSTYRSLLSWPVNVTAIELVPGVRDSFKYFWPDADQVMKNSRGRIVIDDGRRYLLRTSDKYDVITIDPPPPVEAAGSSLLYSTDFYNVVKEHLTPNGIFCQWFPAQAGGDPTVVSAVARSIQQSFKYVNVYFAVEKNGWHFICSQTPFQDISAEKMWQRMPESGKKDLLDLTPQYQDRDFYLFKKLLSSQVSLTELTNQTPDVRITDDTPYNEYYCVRKLSKQKHHPE